jgi:hypothetical protein
MSSSPPKIGSVAEPVAAAAQPFTCSFKPCQQTFASLDDKRTQVDTVHAGTRLSGCRHCCASFATHEDCTAHVASDHPTGE